MAPLFNLKSRRKAANDTNMQSENTSEFQQRDRFSGVEHETRFEHQETVAAPPASLAPSTIMAPPGMASTHSSARKSPVSVRPAPRIASPGTERVLDGLDSEQPEMTDASPADISIADATDYDIQLPDPVEKTGHGLLNQGLQYSLDHRREQSLLGNKIRGFIGPSKYTRNPGEGVHYKQFKNYLSSGSPLEHYTQVLVWCLNRQLDEMKASIKDEIRYDDQLAINAMDDFILQLVEGHPDLNWSRPKYYKYQDDNKPPAPNPKNQSNQQQLVFLEKFHQEIKAEIDEWMSILRECEDHERELSHQFEPQPPANDDIKISLPDIEIDEGLERIATSVAKLQVEVEAAEWRVAQAKLRLKQNPALLTALRLS